MVGDLVQVGIVGDDEITSLQALVALVGCIGICFPRAWEMSAVASCKNLDSGIVAVMLARRWKASWSESDMA